MLFVTCSVDYEIKNTHFHVICGESKFIIITKYLPRKTFIAFFLRLLV